MWPEGVFVLTNDSAIEDQAPFLLFRGGEAQAFERNRHSYHKAAAGYFALRIPDGVKRRIEISVDFVAGGLTPIGIPLHSKRSRLEGVGPTPVVESIQHNLDLIVVVNVLAARHSRAELLRIVKANEDDVQVFLVVAQVSNGFFGNFFAVMRVALYKAGYFCHVRGRLALRFHAKKIFERGAAI